MFTNVPLEEVIEICVDMLYKIEKPVISKNNFKELLKLSTGGVELSFNSQIYSQNDGIAMGPISFFVLYSNKFFLQKFY